MLSTASHETPRYHPRVAAGFAVRLQAQGRTVVARAADLSMAGCKVQGQLGLCGDRLTMQLALPGDRALVTLATVRRRLDDALALEFDELDWDDLIALARFVHARL
jgi:PilZ domain